MKKVFGSDLVRMAYLIAALLAINLLTSFAVSASEENSGSSNSQIIQAFTSGQAEESELVAIEDKEKRLIMFFLGAPLLVFLLTTGVLGIAMGVYGKNVFVAHMVCAGFSMTLALAHAVVGVVWFYPF